MHHSAWREALARKEAARAAAGTDERIQATVKHLAFANRPRLASYPPSSHYLYFRYATPVGHLQTAGSIYKYLHVLKGLSLKN
jgi:hypothetical protein